MRKVVLYSLLSLDGVAEEPGDWVTDTGPEIFDHLAEVIAPQTTVLLGRGTFEYWVDFWPQAGPEPFRTFINDTPKLVVSSRELAADAWANTTVARGGAEAHVRALRDGDGGDIGIHGSIAVAQSLAAAGLVDEYRLVVAGSIAGRGRRLFTDDAPGRALDLVAARSTTAGTLLLHYCAASTADRTIRR